MTAQILSMHAAHASDLGKIQTQFGDKMDTSVGASEPPTPASPDSGENRGRRRDRDEDGDTGDGEGDGQGSSRKRRRSRKGLDKKFECPHEGCGKSYSRAEHLYRHQLNRELLLVASFHIADIAIGSEIANAAQTIPSKSTTATFPTATDPSSAKTYARATRRDTRHEDRNCCAKTHSTCTT
jgi:hypothetical protein